MDKEVLIRGIEFLEAIFSRINSKRLMVFYGLLVFLANSKNMSDMALYLGTGVACLSLVLYMVKTPDDKITLANAVVSASAEVKEPVSQT